MGGATSKDEALRNQIGCDTVGTVPCKDPNSLLCFEGVCALYVAETEKKCVERCKCYPGYFGVSCQFRDSSLFATAGIVGGIIGIFILILIGSIIWCCCHSRRQRRAQNREWERQHSSSHPQGEVGSVAELPANLPSTVVVRPRSGYYEHELRGGRRIIDPRNIDPSLGPVGVETSHLIPQNSRAPQIGFVTAPPYPQT